MAEIVKGYLMMESLLALFFIDPHTDYTAYKNLHRFWDPINEIPISPLRFEYEGEYPSFPDDHSIKWGVQFDFGRLVIKDVCIYLIAKSGNQSLIKVLQILQKELLRQQSLDELVFVLLPSGNYQVSNEGTNTLKTENLIYLSDRSREFQQGITDLLSVVPQAKFIIPVPSESDITIFINILKTFSLDEQILFVYHDFNVQSIKLVLLHALKLAQSTALVSKTIRYLEQEIADK